MNFGGVAATLLLAVAASLAVAVPLSLGLRPGGGGWRERAGVVRGVQGVAALCWLVHFAWVLYYGGQYGVWPGLVAFAATSLLIGVVALKMAAKGAVAPLLLGFYWLVTFPLLRWKFPDDYFSTDDLGQVALGLACSSAALFLLVYRRHR